MSSKKVCKRCGQELPIELFYTHKGMADGHLNICIGCTKKRVMEHREVNLDRIRAYDRIRHQAGASKIARAKYQDWYRTAKENQRQANHAVSNAIRDGKLQKKPCSICGAEPAEAHHEDYSDPLNVIWLCTTHHSRLHHAKFSLVPKFTCTHSNK